MFKQVGGGVDLYFSQKNLPRENKGQFSSFLLRKNYNDTQFAELPVEDMDKLYAEFVAGGSVSGRTISAAGQAELARYGAQLEAPIINCSTRAECDQYGKDDIEAELKRRGFTANPRLSNRSVNMKPNEFAANSTKPELVQILLNHNKREMERLARLRKYGSSSMRGALPSEATNPSMYDPTTGLLLEIHLTQDHHGLTAYDFKGDKYQVFYLPKLNGYGGKAEWKRVGGSGGLLNTCNPIMRTEIDPKTGESIVVPDANCRTLPPNVILDKRGLPFLDQLNYQEHYGISYRAKDGKMYILAPLRRKDLKNFSVHPSNAVVDSNGNIKMQWVLGNSHEWNLNPVGKGADEQKFFLPDGSVVTGKELNKLSLEQIWRMMMLLELMDPENQKSTVDKLKSLNLGPYGEKKVGSQLGGPKRKRTLLDGADRAAEEARYREAALPKCGELDTATNKITPANRCYTDSYIPGACVPHEEICFNSTYEGPWDGSDRYGRNPKMEWAKAKQTELRAAGALESEAAYNMWKQQKAQTDSAIYQKYLPRGDASFMKNSYDPTKTANVTGAYPKMTSGLGTVLGKGKMDTDVGDFSSGAFDPKNAADRAALDALARKQADTI
jgi:hypothetical protein